MKKALANALKQEKELKKPIAKEAVKSEPKKQAKVMKVKKVENKKDKLYTNEEIIQAASKKVADEEKNESQKEA